MNKFLVLFLISLACFFLSQIVWSQTSISSSPKERKLKVVKLEEEWEKNKNPEVLREMAMIYAVIAADDLKKETVKKVEKILGKAAKIYPQDYELIAAHGSVLTMLAKFESKTAKQLRYLKKGTRKMDLAIKKEPDNIGARLQRGNNSLNLPPFLRRTHYAKTDFQYILELTEGQKPPPFKAMILFNLGRAYELTEEKEQAQKFWKKAALLNASPWSEQAKRKIQ